MLGTKVIVYIYRTKNSFFKSDNFLIGILYDRETTSQHKLMLVFNKNDTT